MDNDDMVLCGWRGESRRRNEFFEMSTREGMRQNELCDIFSTLKKIEKRAA